jgi:hypothetical protein
MDGDVGALSFSFYFYHNILFTRGTRQYYFYEEPEITDSSFCPNFLRGTNVLVGTDVFAPC